LRLMERFRRGDLFTSEFQLDGDPNYEQLNMEYENGLSGWRLTFDILYAHEMTVCGVEPPSVFCEPVIVENSDGSYSVSVASGATLVLPDEDITLNSGAFLTKPSVLDQDIVLQDTDSNPIVPDSVVGNVITVDLPSVPVGATLLKTNQTTSYRTGDDGDIEAGRAADFFTLASNNPFGNTNRFTDELGGQTYTNNIIIDWSTYNGSNVLGYYNGDMATGKTWDTAIDDGVALSVGTFTSNWRLSNISEYQNIQQADGTGSFLYSPFNAPSTLFWTSTAQSSLNRYYTRSNNFAVSWSTVGTNARALYCRNFTVTGTTLT